MRSGLSEATLITDAPSARRWLVRHATYARAMGQDAQMWWRRFDPQLAAFILAYIEPNEIVAVQHLVWGPRSFL